VVYSYNDGWIPITFYPLVDAIRLHHMGISAGMDIVLFPPDVDPRIPDTPLNEAHFSIVSQANSTEGLTDNYFQYATKSTGKIKV
jgi:hypothetical protein